MSIYHKHHIIPRHMGGTDDPSNIVLVTIEQHANLHKQLWEDLGHHQDYVAWQGLSGMMGREEIILFLTTGERHHAYGKPRPPDVKRRISYGRKGQSLQSWTEERRMKTVSTLSGRKLSQDHVSKLKHSHIGNKASEETKLKMKAAQQKRRQLEKSLIR